MNKRLLLAAAVASVFGAGCSTTMTQSIESGVHKNDDRTTVMLDHARTGTPAHMQRSRTVKIYSGAWIPVRQVTVAEDQPGHETGKRKFAVNREFASIQDVAERVTLLSGVPVQVMADALAPVETEAPATSSTGIMSSGTGMSLEGLGGLSLRDLMGVNISYSGTLAGFMDVAAARFGVHWKWNDEGTGLVVFRNETRTFRIAALPGNTEQISRVSRDSAGGSGTSSSQQTSVSFEGMSVWTGIEEAVKTMLGENGKVVSSPSTGTITVTDAPSAVATVAEYIKQQNAALGRQVVLNVEVLSVDLSSTHNYGINWDVVYSSLSQNFGWSFSTAFAPAAGSSNLALRVLETASGGNIQRWKGSQAMIHALSEQGRVSQVTSAAVTTLNNQPVPVQSGRQIAYLASSETTLSGDTSTTALTPGVVSTGFSMNLLPHILEGEHLLLQYAVDLSSLINMNQISSGESTIQTPEIETRNFMQRVRMRSGDTLVVAGFEQANLDARHSGVGNARNVLAGGGVRGNDQRNAIVVLIQPIVIDY